MLSTVQHVSHGTKPFTKNDEASGLGASIKQHTVIMIIIMMVVVVVVV